MEDSHSLSNSEIVHDETDLAEKRLNEAMAQRKKELQQLKYNGKTNETEEQRRSNQNYSVQRKKEVPKRNKPWKTIEWQNYWNSLGNHEQNNLDRKKSHCHKSIYTKIEEMAENFNASVRKDRSCVKKRAYGKREPARERKEQRKKESTKKKKMNLNFMTIQIRETSLKKEPAKEIEQNKLFEEEPVSVPMRTHCDWSVQSPFKRVKTAAGFHPPC
ncbi:hypothetical protein DAPPUDRAFT_109762 [Daphnia pulex]|uniref:Uncharacterized protein n=1 Tax=Daphnia pulex TaxID=6669 RepID=E9H444_DAPPU|nr:hypothetical protein DAPPUDRAFT_109762 [Daphnia pulex]|eukprot:EFX73445.1 hypothetical protein DAPPUDRAFT_109762 [Daphnia pulex]